MSPATTGHLDDRWSSIYGDEQLDEDQADELVEARARKVDLDRLLIPEHARPAYVALMRSFGRDRPPCAAVDPDVFFDAEHRSFAVRLCNQCPSRIECRTYAREADERGVWGAEVHR